MFERACLHLHKINIFLYGIITISPNDGSMLSQDWYDNMELSLYGRGHLFVKGYVFTVKGEDYYDLYAANGDNISAYLGDKIIRSVVERE